MNQINERGITDSGTANPTSLLDVDAVAKMLGCSTRHVRRMADYGAMPRPVKLGRLIRWRRVELDRWLDQGCPKIARGGRGR